MSAVIKWEFGKRAMKGKENKTMSVYSVPVTIGVDEKRIAEEIEKNVEDRVVENITKEVKRVMFDKDYYGREDARSLRKMICEQIDKILDDNKDLIIKEATACLANKMSRTKVVKEATKDVVEKVKKGE